MGERVGGLAVGLSVGLGYRLALWVGLQDRVDRLNEQLRETVGEPGDALTVRVAGMLLLGLIVLIERLIERGDADGLGLDSDGEMEGEGHGRQDDAVGVALRVAVDEVDNVPEGEAVLLGVGLPVPVGL